MSRDEGRGIREWIEQRRPLLWIALASVALRGVGLTWGLPSSDAWDNDGIAPRDFWPGLIESFTPGHYFTYPPAHLALLAVVTAPVTAVLLARAPAHSPAAILTEALKIPYMTAYTICARCVTLAMTVGIVLAASRIAEDVAGRRAGHAAAAVCAVCVSLTYYAHTSNLDVPYLFWGTLAVAALVRCVRTGEPRRLRAVALLAAIAVATKDQAYALFLLGVPLALALSVALRAWSSRDAKPLTRELLVAAGIAASALLVLDGVVVNPTGFLARVRFLTGPAQAPYALYSADLVGRSLALLDTVRRFGEHYPVAVGPLVALGLVRAATLPDRNARAAALVPFCVALSFTLLFNCVALRTEHRFLLPQAIASATYAGLGLDWLLETSQGVARWLTRGAVAAAFAWAAFRCADVDANLLLDPRYDAEAWLGEHVRPGDVVEMHGKSVYLPRAPAGSRVVRVGPEPLARRNPIYGAQEVQDSLGDVAVRAPRWIVVSEVYAHHYLLEGTPGPLPSGRIPSATQMSDIGDVDAKRFFRGLLAGDLGYRMAHESTWTSTLWPRVDIHGSVAPTIWVFERTAG